MSTLSKTTNSVTYTAITIIGSFLPLIAAVAYPSIIEEKEISFSEVTGKGEITIICIPLCITILFSLYHYKKEIGINKIAHIIYSITFFWLVIAVGLYVYGIKNITEPKPGLITFSLYFLIWTIISMLIAKFVEDGTIDSIKTSRNTDQDNLEKKFNKTQEQS